MIGFAGSRSHPDERTIVWPLRVVFIAGCKNMATIPNTRDLTGRVALVTGASRRRGIGAAICRALAARGADVAFSHWRPYDTQFSWAGGSEEPEALAASLSGLDVRVAAISSDLSDPDAPARLLDEVTDRLGDISILVNNAAYSTNDGFAHLDAATLDAHYAVNMRGTLLLSVEFARRFTLGDGGRIISLTSGQSLGPMPGELAYAATKGAIEAFTRSLSPAVAPLGITVNAVNPGPTDSGWINAALREELLPRFPAGRIGTPEDAARLVAWLASPDAAWVTGQVIHSEGGFLHA
ncbi:MAG: SDR family oxidoreductase [Thermomicrobiales bacterium]